jgi:hypothetical protein
MRRICKQELLEMAKVKGGGDWTHSYCKILVESISDLNRIRDYLINDCGVDSECINEILAKSDVGGYPTLSYKECQVPVNTLANISYSYYLIGKWDGYEGAMEIINMIADKVGCEHIIEPHDDYVFYVHTPQDIFNESYQGHQYWNNCDNVFTEIFRHSFGIEEVFLAFLLCDEDLETFYEFVGYGAEPEPSPEPEPEPEPSDLPEDRQVLVGDLYSTVRPIQMMYEMLKADKPIDKAELRKCIAQLDMKCKALSADFENILNM